MEPVEPGLPVFKRLRYGRMMKSEPVMYALSSSIELGDMRPLNHLGEAGNVRPELLCKFPGRVADRQLTSRDEPVVDLRIGQRR